MLFKRITKAKTAMNSVKSSRKIRLPGETAEKSVGTTWVRNWWESKEENKVFQNEILWKFMDLLKESLMKCPRHC